MTPPAASSVRSAPPDVPRYLRSGAIAGAVATLIFTAVHHLWISNIWFSFPFMLLAGAACGLGLAWAYALLVPAPSMSSWLRYNALHVALLLLLGAASVAVFEPITTVAALIDANEPPSELFGDAMPLTVAFILLSALAVTWLFGRDWSRFLPVLVTCTVLVLLLGLNISVIGLVDIPRGSAYLVGELYALTAALDVAYATTFIALERASFARG